MANMGASPWEVLQVDQGKILRDGSSPWFADKVVWTEYDDADHKVILHDQFDREICVLKGDTDFANQTHDFGNQQSFNGLKIQAMESGRLYIHIR